jgi:hypothetical protein
MAAKAKAGSRKAAGTMACCPLSSRAGPWITGRIPDACRARKGADASQVGL